MKRYSDFREMFDKQKDIDAVVVATPDHMHAAVAMAALDLEKHVYVQKPLTWSVEEARRLARQAKRTKVATQMGNQGHSWDDGRKAVEWIQSGAIGDVHEVHVWTNRPLAYWPQGIPKPEPHRITSELRVEHVGRDGQARQRDGTVCAARTRCRGSCSSARRRSRNITPSTIRSTGAAGSTGASARSATWART